MSAYGKIQETGGGFYCRITNQAGNVSNKRKLRKTEQNLFLLSDSNATTRIIKLKKKTVLQNIRSVVFPHRCSNTGNTNVMTLHTH